jgi:hypothetical protein
MSIRSWSAALAAVVFVATGSAFGGVPLPIIVNSSLTGSPTVVTGVMAFPAQPVGATSPAQTETMTVHMNATQGGSPVAVPSFFTTTVSTVTVDDPAFAVAGGTCTTPPANQGLNDSNTCTIALTFTPAAAGLHMASVFITCIVVEAVGGASIACDNVQHRLMGLQGTGGLAAIVAAAVPALGSGALTALALLLFGASMLALRRRR